MSYLRVVLDRRDAIVARASGYLLDDETDVQAAVRLIEVAGRAPNDLHHPDAADVSARLADCPL